MSEIIKKQGQNLVATQNDNVKLKAITEGAISPILKAHCWVLSNNITIIQERGYFRSIGGVDMGGGRLQRLLKHKDLKEIIPQEILEKLSTKIQFTDKKGAIQEGYDATTLPRLAIALWEAFLTGTIKEGHTYYDVAKNAGDVVKAFSDMGITGHIYQITGYNQIKGALEIIEYFNNRYVRDLPSDHKRKFEEIGFFNALYKLYGLKRNEQHPWRHPQFFGHIFNKYIYLPLDIILTNGKIQTKGIMNDLLKKHKNNGQTLYAFIEKTGEAQFFGHLGTLTNICRLAKNPKEFEKMFYSFFPDCSPDKNLPLFHNDFMELAMLDIKKLTQKERPKKIENDLFVNESVGSAKIIEAIQQDGLDFKDNNFEATLETIALSKKPT